MLQKTSGIVLSYIRYKESSIICKVFTRELGLKSYLINGVRSQNSKSKIALYQPMTLLDMVVYNKESTGLQRISEVKLTRANQLIPFDFNRTGIALFMTEVLTRSIFENYQNEYLFDFLEKSIIELDRQKCSLSHFPLVFLIEHAKYLGFAPESAKEFLTENQGQPFKLEELESAENFINELITSKYACDVMVPLSLRRKLMDHLLEFYNQQLENNQTWKSMTILRQLLD
ncbi:DNA repair protein RecO [Algoriphagus halophilus]|uniref:DNA repair protein RecO n=1 Tax=Algoriphagus halophilus TaxID=226505 RepID=A0A1N6HNQ4_9BACT|nr:DNA repair protein RecO [Algoriphagus halophilus]SIO21478.1 DNA replication and repair protein RecO [Algoriphagus halophilus]